jgi:hypothetical protein
MYGHGWGFMTDEAERFRGRTDRKHILVEWKLQFSALASYLGVVAAGFVLIPREPPPFGMDMVPGPTALLGRIGLPAVAAIGTGLWVFRRSKTRKGMNAAAFFAGSIVVWASALVLFP